MLFLIFLLNLSLSLAFHDQQCGISPSYERYSNIFDDNGYSNKIINGKESEEGQWPWIVSLYHHKIDPCTSKPQTTYQCTAAIISNRWIITAAHCVASGHDNQIIFIGVGSTNRQKQKIYYIEELHINPRYLTTKHDFLNDDIALLKLNETLVFSEYVQPICLSRNIQLMQNEIVVAAGWGFEFDYLKTKIGKGKLLHAQATKDVSASLSPHLNERHAAVRDLKKCHNVISPVDRTKYICVGGLDMGMMGGDSGGGLMARRNGKWYHVGIASQSALISSRTRIDLYDEIVYTETMQYCDFIEKSTSGEVQCEGSSGKPSTEWQQPRQPPSRRPHQSQEHMRPPNNHRFENGDWGKHSRRPHQPYEHLRPPNGHRFGNGHSRFEQERRNLGRHGYYRHRSHYGYPRRYSRRRFHPREHSRFDFPRRPTFNGYHLQG